MPKEVEPTIIRLKFSPEDFREIYFVNNNNNWIFNKTTKKSFILLSLAILATALSYFFTPLITYRNFYIPLIGITFFLYDFLIKFNQYYKWRKGIESFLDYQLKFKTSILEITQNHISLDQDSTISIENLNQVKSCDITDKYISINGNTTYLFPKKSMSDTEYELLKNTLTQRIKQS